MEDKPHDFEAEQALLGLMLVDGGVRARVSGLVRPELFADPAHGKISAGIARLIARGEPVSAISVRAEVGDVDLEPVGGFAYLGELMVASRAIEADQDEYHARRLADLHRRRTIMSRAEAVIESARRSDAGAEADRLEDALSELAAAARDRATGGLPVKAWGELGTVAPVDRLVRRLLGTASLTVVYGEPGCGKSFFAGDIGMHVALGWPWFGRSVTQGAVLYVAGEGVAGLSNRLAGFRRKHNPDDDAPFFVIPVAINLGPDGTDAERVVSAAKAIEARCGAPVLLVVVDTLARSMGTGDENSTQDMGRFVAACDRIREGTQACVLIVHHKGKSATAGARGSTALLGAADTVIEIEKREAGRVAKVVKQKDGADGVEIGFDLEVVDLGDDDEGEPITTCVVRPQKEIAKAAPKLSPKCRRALDVLGNVLADHPEKHSGTGTIPFVPLTNLAAFRSALKTAGVTSRDNAETERKQFARITEKLDEIGVFRMHGDLCWRVGT